MDSVQINFCGDFLLNSREMLLSLFSSDMLLAETPSGVVIVLIALLCSIPFYLIRILLSRRMMGSVLPAEVYINQVYKSMKEYCLILRPFGKDGYISTNDLIRQGNVFKKIFVNWSIRYITLEEEIESLAKDILKVETVAFVDPDLTMIPKSPQFIVSSNKNWKPNIFRLLRRALCVIIIIPPGTKITSSLEWEVRQTLDSGLLGRFVFVLPPPTHRSHSQVLQSLKKDLYYISNFLRDLHKDSFILYPLRSRNMQYYFMEDRTKLVGLKTYKGPLEEIFREINSVVGHLSFAEKYKHSGQNYWDHSDS